MNTEMPAYRHDLRGEVESFLFHEARLLDENRFAEWLDLIADDAPYWMPVFETLEGDADNSPVEGQWSVMEEGKQFLTTRLERLRTGLAHCEEPRSRTRRLVSNVLVEGEGEEVTVRSNFILFQGRRDKDGDFFVGRREDRLRRSNGSWLIAGRKVFLDHRVLPRAISLFM
jgi:dibenzofuran dioxygenase beta subunit